MTTTKTPPTTQELCLLGPTELDNALRFVAQLPGNGPRPDPGAVADAWRAAARIWSDLAQREAGCADEPGIRPLPAALRDWGERLAAVEAVRQTFDTVPVALGLVELDRLVISQYSLTRAVVERIRATLPRRPGPRRLAALCLPCEPGQADFRLAYRSEREYVFVSDTHDMRLLDTRVLGAAELCAAAVQGHVQAQVCASIGFSANLVNAVRYRGRVVLNNGHHRAHALRAMGITHIPCLIQACGSEQELRQAATREIVDNSALYFEAPRPPLLRDFDHPGLTLAVQAPRLRRQVRVSIHVDSRLVAV